MNLYCYSKYTLKILKSLKTEGRETIMGQY
jgi:hypothetical protein